MRLIAAGARLRVLHQERALDEIVGQGLGFGWAAPPSRTHPHLIPPPCIHSNTPARLLVVLSLPASAPPALFEPPSPPFADGACLPCSDWPAAANPSCCVWCVPLQPRSTPAPAVAPKDSTHGRAFAPKLFAVRWPLTARRCASHALCRARGNDSDRRRLPTLCHSWPALHLSPGSFA